MLRNHTLFAILLISICWCTIGNAQCIDDTHSPFGDQAWLSCNTSVSPHTVRGEAHWIMYDLGADYTVDSLYIWNYNAWGETGSGIREVIVDVSDNGTDWMEVDTFEFAKAPGSWKYTGQTGPALENASGRYFLFTVLSTWDPLGNCAGMGEIKFVLGATTSTRDVQPALAFDVMPNPAADYIDVYLPAQQDVDRVSLFSSTGQRVADHLEPSGQVVQFSLANLPSGTYFVHAFQGAAVGSKAIIKIGAE